MDFRHDMLTHGVNVVAARHEGRLGGLAVAWATQVSKDRVLICVGKQSATRELILASQAFGLSVLTSGQLEVARLFGTKSSRNVDKLAQVAWHTGPTGSPLLDDCGLTLDCRVETVFDLGTSKLIIGQVLAAERVKEAFGPLLYREEDY